jgi:diketogulonate reductase-like aldo/keto reductase
MERDPRSAAIAALRAGLDLGMLHVDTAEMYGEGRVEELVGEVLRGRRDQVFLASKVLPENASRSGVLTACEGTLRRLGTDHLDLYLLHWRGPHPLSETFEAFEALLGAGKVRAYGVSNFDVPDLEEALALVGPRKIACNQIQYHLRDRGAERRVIPYCRQQGIAVVGYSPFGNGDFPGPDTPGGRVLAEVATGIGSTPRRVALAFLVRESGTFTIPKAATLDHVRDNAGGDLQLLPSARDRVDAAFALPGGAKRVLRKLGRMLRR